MVGVSLLFEAWQVWKADPSLLVFRRVRRPLLLLFLLTSPSFTVPLTAPLPLAVHYYSAL